MCVTQDAEHGRCCQELIKAMQQCIGLMDDGSDCCLGNGKLYLWQNTTCTKTECDAGSCLLAGCCHYCCFQWPGQAIVTDEMLLIGLQLRGTLRSRHVVACGSCRWIVVG